MNAKENALRIIRFDHPERITGGPPLHWSSFHGANHEGYEGGSHDCPVGTHWTDIWGTTWYKEHAGVMGFPRGHPLSEPSRLASYRWPDPDDERICRRIYDRAAAFDRHSDQFLNGSHRDALWEKGYMLVGMEDLMVYFYTEPAFVREVFHRIMDFHLGIARHYLKVGVEFVSMSDDLGTQLGPLLGPDLVHEFLVPEYRRLFDLYRRHGVLINFHSCGCIAHMLDTWIDLGVNMLNPLQATANDLDEVRRRTQGKLALSGGVSSGLIFEGPIQRIEREVRQRMWQLGQHGGYFCGPDQGLPFPPEHLEAVQRTVKEHGRYPLERAADDDGKH